MKFSFGMGKRSSPQIPGKSFDFNACAQKPELDNKYHQGGPGQAGLERITRDYRKG
jgi:hypothetical protein